MTSEDPAAADLERSSERWLAWLAAETIRRRHPPRSDLLVLWDLLEEWFASDDFASSPVAAAVIGAPRRPGPGRPRRPRPPPPGHPPAPRAPGPLLRRPRPGGPGRSAPHPGRGRHRRRPDRPPRRRRPPRPRAHPDRPGLSRPAGRGRATGLVGQTAEAAARAALARVRAPVAAVGSRSTAAAEMAPSTRIWSWAASTAGSWAPAVLARSSRSWRRAWRCWDDPGLGGVVGFAAELGGGVGHERAAEAVLGEPGLELVPEGVEAVGGVVAAAVHGVGQAVQPLDAPLLEGGRDQGVLASELAVEGHRGHVGLADDAVHADRADALGVEQRGGGGQDPFPRPGGHHGGCASPCRVGGRENTLSPMRCCQVSANSSSLACSREAVAPTSRKKAMARSSSTRPSAGRAGSSRRAAARRAAASSGRLPISA